MKSSLIPTRRSWLPLLFIAAQTVLAAAQIHQVKEMNTEQIRALPRDKTVVLLPGGILEEHGPYLPSYTDGYQNESLTGQLAKAIEKRPGWHVLIFPVIPLGQGAANEIGDKRVFPGSYDIRSSTLRAVFMDLADDLGQQRFRRIFIVHLHGSPIHNEALDQAGDYFHDTYGGELVSLIGVVGMFGDTARELMTPRQAQEEAFSVHAGMDETSILLHLRPDLVRPWKDAPPQVGTTMPELVQLAKQAEWPGYFGAPSNASAAFGKKVWKAYSAKILERALQILDGKDPRQFPRYADEQRRIISPAGWKATLDAEDAAEGQHLDWLRRKTGAGNVPHENQALEENKRIIRRYFDEWANRGDTAVADELIATNVVLRNPPAVINSLADYKKGMASFHSAFPDLRFTIDDPIVDGEKVVVHWTLLGTQAGDYQGRPPTGKAITVTGISIFRIAGGKIQEIWVNMDRLGMQEQLGWLPATSQTPKP